MDLSNISDDIVLARTFLYSRAERKMTHLVLWHIHEVERRKLFAGLGYDSIFKYISKHLGYGEKAAYERMHASRLLGKMPELAMKMEEGTLNLTQVVQVQSCLNKEARAGNKFDQEKTAKIFEKIESLSGEKTLKTLAVEFKQPIQVHEVIQPQRDNTVRAGITFTDDEMNILKHAKDLLSHALPNPTWAELIIHLAKKQIQTIEGKPSKKPMAAANNYSPHQPNNSQGELGDNNEESAEKPVKMAQRFGVTRERKSIKITTRRELMMKAEKCCEFVNPASGQRCDGAYQLQVDHKIPLALGGSNNISNLRVLCRTHNLLEAKRFGLTWRKSNSSHDK